MSHRSGWRQFARVGLPAIGISLVGSVILSRFVLSTVEMRDKRVTTASESDFDRQFREKVSDKKVKLSDEYEVRLHPSLKIRPRA